MQLENMKLARHFTHITDLKVSQDPKTCCWISCCSCCQKILSWIDEKRGVDYDTQKETVEELYENILDSDEDSKVV